ncbi:hypothetical protein KY290_000778 [Solanum tuberosum]|uniref:Uncharacterized protein n=1 Tax=Solanum tuberosum TaxID=4113 RepID=A0ABQ7WKC3_SOLTU|nr:hypothetical protein KY289_000843 [Solanum tuberosum]KAH0781180.1 hypothetical protein KY290_000778 [Solanum tuberosum]
MSARATQDQRNNMRKREGTEQRAEESSIEHASVAFPRRKMKTVAVALLVALIVVVEVPF